MSLNNQLTKVGLYLLANEVARNPFPTSVVGGLAVQIAGYSSYPQFLRPTSDVDISTPRTEFGEFRDQHGLAMGRVAKNKFDLGYHLIDGHFSNGLELISETRSGDKDTFWIHFNRLQPELYDRIQEHLMKEIEEESYDISLGEIGITPETIRTKAKISTENLKIRVLKPEKVLKTKFGRVVKKTAEIAPGILSQYYGRLAEKVVNNGMSYSATDVSLEEAYLNYMAGTAVTARQKIEKDIFDFVFLKKVLGK